MAREFVLGEVSEAVDGLGVGGIIAAVVEGDVGLGCLPYTEAESVLLMAEVVLVMFLHPVHELLLVLRDHHPTSVFQLGSTRLETYIANDPHQGSQAYHGQHNPDLALTRALWHKEAILHSALNFIDI